MEAVSRYMKDLESKAGQEKKFIHDTHRMRQTFNSLDLINFKQKSEINNEVSRTIQN